MSNPPTGADARHVPDPPPRTGMSPAVKIILILLGIFGLLAALCCGGVIYLSYRAQSYAKEMFSDDPDIIVATSVEITEIDVPAEMKPKFSMNIKVPFTGQRVMAAAVYTDEDNQSALIVGGAGEMFEGQGQADVQQQIKQTLQQHGVESGDEKGLELEEIRTIERQIRGQPATFVINKGADSDSGREVIQVNGAFQGKTGPAMFLLTVDPDTYDEDRVVEIIESIE